MLSERYTIMLVNNIDPGGMFHSCSKCMVPYKQDLANLFLSRNLLKTIKNNLINIKRIVKTFITTIYLPPLDIQLPRSSSDTSAKPVCNKTMLNMVTMNKTFFHLRNKIFVIFYLK